MIVFIAGMQRSGSTFCFNVVREILLEQNGSVYCTPSGDLAAAQAAAGDADHIVLKAHSASPDLIEAVKKGRVKSIVSIRRIEEAIASCVDIWGMPLEEVIINLKLWRDMYRAIGTSSLRIPFEAIDQRPGEVAKEVASFLSLHTDLTSIAIKYGKTAVEAATRGMQRDQAGVRDVGFSYYDEQTLFHRRHVSSLAPRDVTKSLSASNLARVREEFAELVNLDR